LLARAVSSSSANRFARCQTVNAAERDKITPTQPAKMLNQT